MEKLSTFVPGICCDHNWIGSRNRSECAKCGAVCSRDEHGIISAYSAGDSKRIGNEPAEYTKNPDPRW